MKKHHLFYLILIILCFLFQACYLTPEYVQYREEFFQPISVAPQRKVAVFSSNEIEQLRKQLDSATMVAIMLRDSLASLKNYTGNLLGSTRSLLDKVTELENKEFLTSAKQKDIERNIADLKLESKKLSQQLNELQARFVLGSVERETVYYSSPQLTPSLANEYSSVLLLFYQKKYEEAHYKFKNLLEKGIQEDLSDNCEYWIGECYFAERRYRNAIEQFHKVIRIESSNKIIDSYFMLGRTYERIGDLVKAQWAYTELNRLYPENEHAYNVRTRLNIIEKKLPKQTKPLNNTDKARI